MFKSTLSARSLRAVLLTGAATATVFAFTGPVAAQEAGGAAAETVVVTGSRLPQTGLVSSSPVAVVGQQEAKFEGTTGVETLLNNLPGVFAEFGSFQSNGTVGTASVNLRGLGSNRTLVLIDGRRLQPGDPIFPVADLNNIPAPLVERVEVVTGGASAVYGSDAIAGVVNFIMRKDFEGIELDGTWGMNQHNNDSGVAAARDASPFSPPVVRAPSEVWDGQTVDGTVIIGANTDNGKGNVTLYAGYRRIQSVLQDQRDFSDCAGASATIFVGDPKGFICLGSSNAQVGNIRSLDNGPHKNVPFRTNDNGDITPYHGTDAYNYAPINYLQRPDTRYLLGGFAHYEAAKWFDMYLQAGFMEDYSVAQIAPSAYFTLREDVNCANPYLQTGGSPSAFDIYCTDQGLGLGDTAHLQVRKRLVEGGPRQDRLDHASYRIVWGVKGDLGDGWSYDVYGQYGKTTFSDVYKGDYNTDKMQNALLAVDVGGVPTCLSVLDGSDPACVPINIFTNHQVTPEALAYISAVGIIAGGTTERILSGSLTGDLGSIGFQSPWAANPVQVAFGAEYRSEGIVYQPDTLFGLGLLPGRGGASPAVDAELSQKELFGEIRVPLVTDAPFAKLLQVEGAYRYSDYGASGSASTYKYSAEWQPIDDFRLRGSVQHAVRAPNVLELFTPQTQGLWAGGDPCGTAMNLTAAQCALTNGGVPLATYGTSILDCPAGQCTGVFGGNPTLSPEIADTRSFGIVLTPTFMPGFSATIDYFDIDLENAVGGVPQLSIITGCAKTGAPAQCSLIHRDPVTGQIYGATGWIVSTNTNTGFLKTHGFDFEANYQTDLADWNMGNNGSLAFSFNGTLTQSLEIEPVTKSVAVAAGTDPPYSYDCAGLFGNVCLVPIPEWKHKFRATWSSPWDVDLSLQWRHLSSVSLDVNTNNAILNGLCGGPCGDTADASIPAFDYFDLSAAWRVWDGVELHAGVNNIFDKSPPIIDSYYMATPPFGNGNTFPQAYDPLGRFVFVSATVKM